MIFFAEESLVPPYYIHHGRQTKSVTISGASNSSIELVSYSYNGYGVEQQTQGEGGTLAQTTYGNGQYAQYTYDEFDRLTEVKYNNNGRFIHYSYNSEGVLSELSYGDGSTAKGSYEFEYDSLGRLIRSAEYDGSGTLIQRTEHNYDAYNRLSAQRWMLGSTSYSESYTYSDGENGDGSLTKMTTGTGKTLNYSYDAVKRLQNVKVKDGGTTLFTTACAYRAISNNRSSAQVEFRNVRKGEYGEILEGAKYTYDACGNITMISQSTGNYYPLVKYTYDSQNQLTSEVYYNGAGSTITNITKAYYYTYDTAGNLRKVEEGTVVDGAIVKTDKQTYEYGNSNWKDQLTAVNNCSIVYDNSGNPTTYRNGNGDTYTLQWKNGRQLTFINCTTDQWMASNFYDVDGIRTKKIVETPGECPVSEYVTQNGKVVRETRTDLNDDTNIVLDFIYDESGRPFALITREGANDPDPDTYYYILNLQGDVVKLVDDGGDVQAVYSYDAWGNILDVTDDNGNPITSQTHIAHVNPLRYRGYYYDRETGWYYLQSRYYDPVIHRFINADCFASTGQGVLGCNMFAYCNNSPVCCLDERATIPNQCNMVSDGGEYTYSPPVKATGNGAAKYKNSAGTTRTWSFNYEATQVAYYGYGHATWVGDISEIDNLTSNVTISSLNTVYLWGKKLDDLGHNKHGAYFCFANHANDDDGQWTTKVITVKIEVTVSYCRSSSPPSDINKHLLGGAYELDGIMQSGANGGGLFGVSYAGGNPWYATIR